MGASLDRYRWGVQTKRYGTMSGKCVTRGFEAEVSYNKSINKDFGFNVAFNMSAIKNKMTELDGDVSYIGLPTSVIHSLNFDQEVSRSAIGQPIGSFYAYKEDGFIPERGGDQIIYQ